MYHLFLACLLALLLPSCFAAWPDSPFFGPHTAVTPFSNLTIYKPGKNYTTPGVLYARTLELEGGVLLATWENFSPEPPLVYFPIYESIDNGETWKEISRVTDTANKWGLRYQPFLYLLPQPVGRYPAGTILLSGNSIPTNLNATRIDLYASFDKGHSWEFVSHVAEGGPPVPEDGHTPIWEPFLLYYSDELIVYYSDQRDPLHSQKLVHQTSRDLLTWSPPVEDLAYPTYTDRPGMTTVSLLPDGLYLMTYEWGGGPVASPSKPFDFPIHYRLSPDPLGFASAPDFPIITTSGIQPISAPYHTWSPIGGPNGTIVLSCYKFDDLYVNQELGAPGAWKVLKAPQGIGYARSLRVLQRDPRYLLLAGAGFLSPATGNKVVVSVMDLEESLLAGARGGWGPGGIF